MGLHGCRKSIKTCIEMKHTKCGGVLTPGGVGEVEERGRGGGSKFYFFERAHGEKEVFLCSPLS